jgi:hypothetical protein
VEEEEEPKTKINARSHYKPKKHRECRLFLPEGPLVGGGGDEGEGGDEGGD